MIIARQSTARIVTVGPVLDADGVAVTDGVVGDFKLSKNGGAPAALNGSATLTHRNTGHYSLSLTATDLDTVGSAEIVIDDTVNSCPMKVITVIEEAIYDGLYAASAAAIPSAAAGASGGLHINGSNSGTTTYAALTCTGTFTISDGLVITRSTSNANAFSATGNGTGHGAVFTSGSGATGDGVRMVAASTNGDGLDLVQTGTGASLRATDVVIEDQWSCVDFVVSADFNVGGVFLATGGFEISGVSNVAQTGNSYTIVSSGTFGNAALKTLIDTVDDLLDTEVAAIKTDTAAILLDTGTDGVVVASHTTAAKAEINTEVLDVINVDTFAEVGQETPAATNTIRKAIFYLFKAWRNRKQQTSSQFSLYADDATTVDQKASVTDDGTTTTIGEVTAGP